LVKDLEMAILIKNENIEPEIMDLIYEKQLQFTKEKGRKVSLERTIARLLKEAYIKPKALRNA
jgi:hypothetical protein